VIVSLVDSTRSTIGSVQTDSTGTFAFEQLGRQPYNLVFHRNGYWNVTKRSMIPGESVHLIVMMVTNPKVLEETVIEAPSRVPEPQLKAPASNSLITQRQLEQQTVLTPVAPTRTEPGVDFASKGMLQATYAVRGHRSINSGALLVMTDYRYAGVPALDINIPYLMAISKESMERIEIARGPGSALYGPNSDRGILQVITRSPFSTPRNSLSISLGQRDLLQGRIRHAGIIGPRIAYEFSGEYFKGNDWGYVDPAEQQYRQAALDEGADPDTLRIGNRDNSIRQATADVRLDWTPRDSTNWTLTAGVADAVNIVDLTPLLGAVQVKKWVYPYAQLRVRSGQFFGNAFFNGSSSGDTYALRTGYPLVDKSWLFALQAQYTSRLGRTLLTYGVDARHTEPRTEGTINGRNETSDAMTELGGYLSLNQPLGRKATFVGALRADYHDRINDLTFSPRLGLILSPGTQQALRLTYNRAFSSPDATALFVDTGRGFYDPFPYEFRVSAVPQDGFTFSRDCENGLCMQTPWKQLPSPLPADATLAWDVLDSLLALEGQDISSIDAPDASQVGTDLRLVAPDGTLIPVQPGDIGNVPGPRRVIRNTLEAGYQGAVVNRTILSADVYWTNITDNRGPLRAITPSVYFNQESLEAYLVASNVPPDLAAAIASTATRIPMGTVSPDQVDGSSDILIVDIQSGDYSYSFWGIDLSIQANLSSTLSLGGDYSFFSKNVYEGVDIIGTVVLDVPINKGAAWIKYQDEVSGLSAGLRGRAVGGFPVDSGVYKGDVDPYAVLDLMASYRLSRTPRIDLSLDASNVLDDRHQEYVGAPEIGRLVILNLAVSF